MKQLNCRTTAQPVSLPLSLQPSWAFPLIWHIWWLVILNFVAAVVVVLIAGWSIEREEEISAAEVAQMEQAR